MSTIFARVPVSLIFLVLIFASGFWLKNHGKPYNKVMLNVHKLISLAAAVFLGITIYRIGKVSGFSINGTVVVVITSVLFISAIISGGLTSMDKMPRIVLRIHQITLSLATVSTGIILYLLV